jgi:outer membrane protein insertion porin family
MEELDLADVVYETRGAAISWGIPVTENDRVFVGAKWENTVVDLNPNSPSRYHNYVAQFGEDPHAIAATIGWSRDSRDSALVPTRGTFQRVNGELALPVLDLSYYRLNYQIQHYYPITKDLTFAFNGEIGYGGGYGGKAYPFFKNFYAGGIGSVRGFESSSLGPQDEDGDSEGGSATVNFSFEILTPLPGADRTLRAFAFLDGGMVWGDRYEGNVLKEKRKIELGDMRYSVGFGIAWISPMGPLKFSIATPLNDKEGDDVERFQFQIGTGF